jgi:hypothetical protein
MAATLFWLAYSELLYTVQTGQSGFQRAFGMSIYDNLAKNPELDASYAAVMTAATGKMAAVLASSFDFSGMRTVVDVGGGRGALMSGILRAHPHLRGILFDRSHAVGGAQRVLERTASPRAPRSVPATSSKPFPAVVTSMCSSGSSQNGPLIGRQSSSTTAGAR